MAKYYIAYYTKSIGIQDARKAKTIYFSDEK